MTSPPAESFDAGRMSTARRYSELIGGKDTFAVDREAADELRNALSSVNRSAEELRRCMGRMVYHLASELGIRQFLDIGCGMPHSPNVHEIAQDVDPACRIVYVDPDPLVAVHARALLRGNPQGASQFEVGDLHDIETILSSTAVRSVLDFDEPIAVLLLAVLHFVVSDEEALHIVGRIRDALPAGSYLAISHVTFDPLQPDHRRRLTDLARSGRQGDFEARTWEQVTSYFAGLEMVGPGLVPTVRWHPELYPQPRASVTEAVAYAGIGRIVRTGEKA